MWLSSTTPQKVSLLPVVASIQGTLVTGLHLRAKAASRGMCDLAVGLSMCARGQTFERIQSVKFERAFLGMRRESISYTNAQTRAIISDRLQV